MNITGTTGTASGDMNSISKKDIRDMEHDDFMQVLRGQIEQTYEKIVNGETETSYQIGGSSYTIKEWDKIIKEYDKTQDKIREDIKQDIEKRQEQEELKRRLGYKGYREYRDYVNGIVG